MAKTLELTTLLAAALLLSFPGVTAGQAVTDELEATEWHLIAYGEDGESTPVPWYVRPTLSLDAGQGLGVTGCGEFYAKYDRAGGAIALEQPEITDVGCSGEGERVQTHYLAALPASTTWAIEPSPPGSGQLALTMYDGDGDVTLAFSDSKPGPTDADLASLAVRLDAQQRRIQRLTRQVDMLREEVRQARAEP